MKNVQSLHNWQIQSLNFQEMSEMIPGKVILKKCQQKSPRNHKITNLTLESSKLHKWQNRSPKFQNLSVLVPGSLFWKEKSILVLGNSQSIIINPWIKSLRKLQNWSLKFQKWQNSPWVFKKWKFIKIYPCTIHN